MCYDNSLKVKISKLVEAIPFPTKVQTDLVFEPTFHKIGMSYPLWPVVVDRNGPELHGFTWGPIPKMLNTEEKVKKRRKLYLNCRSEKILDPAAKIWYPIRGQRCLIPSTGFFEYREVPGQKNKVCYTINQGEDKVFFIAGLWAMSSSWNPEGPEKIPTFTLITREANPVLKQIHNAGENPGRMPLMLPDTMLDSWINPDLTDFQMQEILNYSMPAENLQYYPVNSVRKKHPDDESVIQPIDTTGIPPVIAV